MTFRTLVSAVSLLVPVLAGPSSALAQSKSTSVALLLEYSEVESILSGYRGRFETQLSALRVELASDLVAAMDRHLSVEALLPVMSSRLAAQGDVAAIDQAVRLVQDGALARVKAIIDASGPSLTMEEYIRAIRVRPPPSDRLQLVAQIVGAQAAGDFFVMIEERTREAAHIIANVTSPGSVAFESITREARAQQVRRNAAGALVSFLRRFEHVSDADLRAELADWSGEAGVWFVTAYGVALGETALEAAGSIVQELRY